MTFGRWVAGITVALSMLLAGCGGGSGRSGTDLYVNGVGPSSKVSGGDAVAFVMTVGNSGQYAANNVTIRNTLLQVSQAALTITCTASGGAACPATLGQTMSAGTMPPGSTLVFQLNSVATDGASGSIGDTMVVSSDTTDTNSDNNSFSVTAAVGSNDVSITGTPPTGPIFSGPATFTMVVTNVGLDEARNVSLATTASTGVTFNTADVSCVPSAGAVAPELQSDGTLLTPSIPVNGVLTCTVPVVVGVDSGNFALVSMTATSAGDARTSNNSATATVNTTTTNDVAVVGTPPTGPLVTQTATFTMVVSNAGPDKASDVSLATTTTSNLTVVPADIACAPTGGASSAVLQSDGTLLVSTLPMGGTLTCNVPVSLVAGTTGLATVTMVATAVGDTRSANNTGKASVSTNLSNNMSVSGSALSSQVAGGQATTFTAVVTNTGPSTAYDVALSNVLGSDLSLTGDITCVPSLGASTPVAVSGGFTVAAIPLNGVVTCTLPLVVAAGANGTVSTTFTATAAGDTNAFDNNARISTVAVSSDLGVSQSGTAQLSAGKTSTFVALVSNPGPGTASNVKVNWSYTAPTGAVVATPTCVGTGGATCPTNLGPNMTVASLGQGRTLQFTFAVTTDSATRGAIVNTVTVASDEDQNLSNNSSSSSTQVVDGRNGTYTVFASDGHQYDMAVDFDARQYTMSGNGSSVTLAFTPNGSGDYVVAGNARLRTGDDIIIGNHDFDGSGTSVQPYIAARNFNNQLSQLAGTYDLATLNVDSAGNITTRPGNALISGNTLTLCQSDTLEVQTVRNCALSARKDYLNLTISNGVVTGYITATGEQISFMVATSGGAKILLSAGLVTDGTQQLRIGLIDSNAGYTYGPGLRGPSNTGSGDWTAATLTLGANSNPIFASTGTTGPSDTVTLVNINNAGTGPFSMLEGTSQIYGATIYVIQAYPLVVAVGGAPSYVGPSSGYLQLGLP